MSKRLSVKEQAAQDVAAFLKPIADLDPKARGREHDIPATRELDSAVTRMKEAMIAALPVVKTGYSAPDEMRPRPGIFNRLPEEFRGPAWDAFVEEIRSTGGNHTAVQVIRSPTGRHEIIDGERRWRACQAVGVQVLFDERHAATPEQKLTLERLFVTANEQRADRSYASKCLLMADTSARLGNPAGRKLSEDLGLPYSTVALRLAHAPLVAQLKDVVSDIHAVGRPQLKLLSDAVAAKPDVLADVVASLKGTRISLREIMTRLRAPASPTSTTREKYRLVTTQKGTSVTLPVMTELQQQALREFLDRLMG